MRIGIDIDDTITNSYKEIFEQTKVEKVQTSLKEVDDKIMTIDDLLDNIESNK